MICKNCGQMLDDGLSHCPKCGQEIKKSINGTKLAAIIVGIILAVCAIAGIIWALTRSAQDGNTNPTQPTTLTEGTNPTNVSDPTEATVSEEVLAMHPVLDRDSYTGEEGDLSKLGDIVATIDDNDLTNSQFAVWYWQTYYDLVSQFGGYASMYGLDTTAPLDGQECMIAEVNMTWEQFLIEQSLSNWHTYMSLYLEAKANNLTINEENQQTLDNLEEEMAAAAKTYGFEDAAAMLVSDYGEGVTMEDYRYFMEVLMLGNQYYTQQAEALAPTAEEVDVYYQENSANYITNGIEQNDMPANVNVRHILIKPASVPAGESTDASDPTEETQSQEELLALSREKAQSILDQWKAGEATEESFGALATKFTEDPGSASNGGLYENVLPGQMVAEFNDWCFDPARKPGDTALVETSYGIHVMYFVSGADTAYWYSCASEDLTAQRMNDLMAETTAKYAMESDYAKIWLTPVEMSALA